MTDEVQRSKIILRILNKIYPITPIPLKHNSKFTLLVSVLLSAQCTDVNVNNVTKNIYPKYNKPEHFVRLGEKKIEKVRENWSQQILTDLRTLVSFLKSC